MGSPTSYRSARTVFTRLAGERGRGVETEAIAFDIEVLSSRGIWPEDPLDLLRLLAIPLPVLRSRIARVERFEKVASDFSKTLALVCSSQAATRTRLTRARSVR
jgi:hypothetical protein